MVDCDEGACAKQEPTNFLVASLEQATIAKQQHRQCNDQFLCPMSYCKKLRRWRQRLIATSAQDCLSKILTYDRCGSTTLTIAKVQSASDIIDRDNTTIMSTTRQLFLVKLQGVMTTTENLRENVTTPKQQSIFHVVVRRMQRRPYRATR